MLRLNQYELLLHHFLRNKSFKPSSKNALIKRNLEILEKINRPNFGFLRRKRKENGIYSEIRSHLSKMSQFTKGSKISSKTYTNQIYLTEIECMQCKQDISSWNKTPAEFLLEEFLKQIFINEYTDQEKVDEIEHMCQKCLIKKYFDDDSELYQKFCKACTLEIERKDSKQVNTDKACNDVQNEPKAQNDEMNKTCVLPRLNYSFKEKDEQFRNSKEFQENYHKIINHYSKDFPNPVIPVEFEMRWQKVYDSLFGGELKK